MSDEAYKSQLSEAHQAFNEGKFSDAEAILKKLPQDNLKVQHNLAAVQYLLQEVDADQAIAMLEEGLPERVWESPSFALLYDGHETALYNLATVYARSGHPHKATVVLRRVLEMRMKVDVSILGKSVCLFHTLTSPSLGKRQRKEEDEELENSAIKCIVNSNEANKEATTHALTLFDYISNSSALVGAVKDMTNPVERAMGLNNLGAFSLTEKKPYVATLCFHKARECLGSQPQHYMSTPINYNAGLCALLREEYEPAIESFLSVQDSMKSSALFWVRLGEAALGALQQVKRAAQQEDYCRRQTEYSNLLHSGHLYENFEYLLLPNAALTRGPSQEPVFRESPASPVAEELEKLAATALQNALFLLVPPGYTYATARSAFPHNETLLSYALLYWTCLELYRKNYTAVEVVGQSLLDLHDRPPPANLHATLLTYLVMALVHLNDPEKAMRVLRRCQPSSLITGNASAGDQTDVAQRSRVEVLLIHLAITQILSGAWTQAGLTMESLISKIFESAPVGATEFQPEADALFAYQLLAVFLELAQGKQSEAVALLSKMEWSI